MLICREFVQSLLFGSVRIPKVRVGSFLLYAVLRARSLPGRLVFVMCSPEERPPQGLRHICFRDSASSLDLASAQPSVHGDIRPAIRSFGDLAKWVSEVRAWFIILCKLHSYVNASLVRARC
jgi:hypothetical protein